MARRKSKFMDQDSDSDSLDESQDELPADDFVGDDEDNIVPIPSRGKKRTREQLKEDATYGIWAQEDEDQPTRTRRGMGTASSSSASSSRAAGKRTDYLAGQSFVKAGSGSSSNALSRKEQEEPIDNLSTALAIEDTRSDEEDIAMEMNSSDEENDDDDHQPENDQEEEDYQEEEEDLAPIPGLNPPSTSTTGEAEEPSNPPIENETVNSLGFAPRGLGSSRRGGRGGLGSMTGARSGIGGAGLGARSGIGSMSMFAAATSASTSSSTSTQPKKSDDTSSGTSEAGGSGASTPRTGLGSSSSTRNGIGSRPPSSLVDTLRAELNNNSSNSTPSPTPSTDTPTPARQPPAQVPHTIPSTSSSTPSVSAPTARRSFLPSAPPSSSKPPVKPLSRSESLHFNSLRSTNSIGLKLLEKMGWSASSGVGLGKDGTGIVVPLGEGQKVRAKGEGIKSGERTKASWEEEARRKGVSVKELMGTKEEEDEKEGKRERKKERQKEAWTGTGERKGTGTGTGGKRKEKVRTEFKTYEEILKENGEDGEGERPRELLVDLSGNALPDQTITSSLPAYGAGSADPTRLPELRHNLVLLTSTLSSHLRALAKEGSTVISRRKYILAEEERVRKGVERQEEKMKRLQQVLSVVERVKEKETEAREVMSMLQEGEEMSQLLEKFEDEFDRLLGEFGEEYQEIKLDQVVVSAITPICRRIFQTWSPLSSPSLCVSQLKRYRKHFLIDKHLSQASQSTSAVDLYGNAEEERAVSERRRMKMEAEREMTAFESFMWTVWLPKIRSAINNDWSASNPSPAIALFTTWSPLLPSFLFSNILDQLILPKLSSAISDWSPSSYKRGQAPGLHTIVFPWLEVAGEERMEGLLEECKRRVRGWVKTGWKAKEGVPQGLEVWKDAFSKSDWDTLLLQHVLPSLGSLLRDKLLINPRSQDLAPLESILTWKPLLSSSMLASLIESEFFPKWGQALYVWLKSDGVNLEQVAEWYGWWKGWFPEDVVALKGVERGFRKGLDLMNQAMALGEDVKYRLKKPDFSPKQSSRSSSSRKLPSSSSTPKPAPAPSTTTTTSISFRSIVEDLCSFSNLLFLSTGRTTPKGQNLYRVSENVEGKGGVLCYLEEDVVWLVSAAGGAGGEGEPVGIEEMIRRAKGGK
ncbi:uncharacterized protein JCM6883_006345 [Sporobolomyces salmoneus]|uniref:uncharacterized protein n=1 Tax=Sporobolomyces salmoneus TaxID=183962 RepID=UPI00317ED451